MDLVYAQIAHRAVITPDHAVYLLYGRDQVLLEDALGKLIAGVKQTTGAVPDQVSLYGNAATCEAITGELANLSLMGTGKVVVVREANRMRAPEQAKLAELLPRLGRESLLVLLAGEATYDSRAKRKKILAEKLESMVRKVGVTIEFPAFRDQDAERWVVNAAKEAGVELEPRAAGQMVLLAGAELSRLRSELEKVITFAGAERKVSVADIALVVSRSPEATVFELIDAIGSRHPDQALSALKILMDAGEPAPRILAMIVRQIRLIWQAKYLAEKGYLKHNGANVPAEVEQNLLPHDRSTSVMSQVNRPFLREKLLRQAGAFSWSALRRGMERVLAADLAFKGIEGDVDDPRLVLEMLVLELASSGRSRTPGREH